MTCIVGFRTPAGVWIGGDAAGCSGYDLQISASPKVFGNGSYLVGYTSSFRMGQLLQYSLALSPPPTDPADLFQHMATTFVNEVRDCFKLGGVAAKDKDVEAGGTFLVGVRGRLFCVYQDYQVFESLSQFLAVGSGAPYALGALAALGATDAPNLKPAELVRRALSVSAEYSMGVRGPFTVLEQAAP